MIAGGGWGDGGGVCVAELMPGMGFPPGGVERHRMRPCKRTLAVRCRRGQRKGLIYVHKFMGTVLSLSLRDVRGFRIGVQR